jgi:hypothetical protein
VFGSVVAIGVIHKEVAPSPFLRTVKINIEGQIVLWERSSTRRHGVVLLLADRVKQQNATC